MSNITPGNSQDGLVTIAKEVVLGANVLVSVLSALLKRSHVVPVLPVLVPEVVGIDRGDDDDRGKGTGKQVSSVGEIRVRVHVRGRAILEGQLAPELCRGCISGGTAGGNVPRAGAYRWTRRRGA